METLGRKEVHDGSAVTALQNDLVKLGILTEADRRGGEGHFGPRTEASVREFQRSAGLGVSGTADATTQVAIGAIASGSDFRRGAGSAAVVRAMQNRLVNLGAMDRDRIGAGAGTFGSYTEESLKRFQASQNIDQTGVLGPVTYKALFGSGAQRQTARAPEQAPPAPAGGHHRFILPIRNMRVARLNKTLHGRSWYRSSDHKGHNVFLGWSHAGIGDALDIFAPEGTPVYAIADGEITYYNGRGSGILEHIYLSGPGWEATYAHIHSFHGKGTKLKQGDVVGTLRHLKGGSHLHFELWIGGTAIHARSSTLLRQKMLERLDESSRFSDPSRATKLPAPETSSSPGVQRLATSTTQQPTPSSENHPPKFHAIRSKVRGERPPVAFLNEMIAWGRKAPATIFSSQGGSSGVYKSVYHRLGPWKSDLHRRAVMLEVMRVLARWESEWNWSEGRDKSVKKPGPPETWEAGAWQVSANSMRLPHCGDLRQLVLSRVGSLETDAFRRAMKQDHPLAMEYIARLLRHTTHANGPVVRKEINSSLSPDAVAEFMTLLQPSNV